MIPLFVIDRSSPLSTKKNLAAVVVWQTPLEQNNKRNQFSQIIFLTGEEILLKQRNCQE